MKSILAFLFATTLLNSSYARAEKCQNLKKTAAKAVMTAVAYTFGSESASICGAEMQLLNVLSVKDQDRYGSYYIFAFYRKNCDLTGLYTAAFMEDDNGQCVNTSVSVGNRNND